MRPRVLVLGGGFAGLSCALALPAPRFAVTLADRSQSFEFLPAIHELVSGLKDPAQLRLPLKAVLARRGHRFRRGEVERIDPVARTVHFTRGSLDYDRLVIALGADDADFGVSGAQQNAMPFKSVAQCAAIGRQLRALLRKERPGRVTIIGGGLEGVECLGEVLRVRGSRTVPVTVVEAGPRLLPGAPAAVGRYLADHCETAGVTLALGDPVDRVTPRTVRLASGRRLRSALTIWTGGPAPLPLLAGSGLAAPGRWAGVSASLHLEGHEDIFVAGDTAELPEPLARQAYHAMDMGRHCARELERQERGLRPLAFKATEKPQLIAFGERDCLLLQGRHALASPSLALGKEAIFQAVMAQLDQRPLSDRIAALLRRGAGARESVSWPVPRLGELRRRGRLRILC
ncbi:NAD(P)/FAD-dependent oxidoreductase [Pseudohaliea rubra]|uniref:NADH dehydrogenase n=1 Tax=Pseudohaliea rubra DSM 19751 TaxID=1265313 RepID=A0A095X2N8_9GAMM|nr:FAD-dependent oxidoreductase [Pseudohaliea rubra]KGE05119.1 NADH dehydrogenase [Pseudohaliea rubra DSM 19751]